MTSSESDESSTYLDQLKKQIRVLEPVQQISIERYLLSGQTLLNQANIYRTSGDLGSLYLFLYRFANLFLHTLPKHHRYDSKLPQLVHYRKKLRDECIPELERLKVKLEKIPARTPQLKKTLSKDLVQIGLSNAPQVNWNESGAPERDPLPPRSTETIPAEIASAPETKNDVFDLPSRPPVYEPKYAASSLGRAKHSLLQNSTAEASSQSINLPSQTSVYPTPVQAVIEEPLIVDVPKEVPLGPQQVEVQNVQLPTSPPEGKPQSCQHSPSPISEQTIVPKPHVEPTNQMQKTEFRNVHISVGMMEAFLQVARANTAREIETCAILAGELRPDLNILEVNHLLVPRQKGTRDQVEMIDEEILLTEVLSKGLMVLGWIHTHPVFQCFLSSIDVHTTLPYQLLLEEAIAVVMAPTDRKRKCGVFRLTTPGGMDLIRDCQLRGFHQHGRTFTRQPIYEVSSHVFVDPNLKVTVKDMR